MKAEAPFLNQILNMYEVPRVLDAATGMGCETTWLLRRGIDVTSNEINPTMQRIAESYASSQGLCLRLRNHDWLYFDTEYEYDSFDITLLLGNSLCLVKSMVDREKVAANLWKICASGGIVVVDERNFRYIEGESQAILNGDFRYSGKYMYCGNLITAIPIKILPQEVTFAFRNGISNELIAEVDMYPFKRGEIRDLFENAGFKLHALYSDFQVGESDLADFFTYIFKKVD
jgi:SAM-dependent methyltransferase